MTLSAVEVVRRRAEREIDVAERVVGAHDAPHVDAADGVARGPLPRVIAELPRPGDGVEDPPLLAGTRVEGTDVAGRHVGTHGPALNRRPDDDDVTGDERG